MKLGALVSLVSQNVARSKKNFVMSGFGIVVGVATFVFFIGLGEGIKSVVLGRIFIVDQLEVVRRTFDTGLTQSDSVFGLGGTRPLDDDAVRELKALPGVRAVYPKMKFTFPTRGWGGKSVFGRDIYAEIIADGIDPELVAGDLEDRSKFVDRDAPVACSDDAACPAGRRCEAGQCKQVACEYVEEDSGRNCPAGSFCTEERRCELPIPVIVSNHLLELYNGSLATALGGPRGRMPRLSKSALVGFQLNATFGQSFLGRSSKGRPLTRRMELVGFSDKAISVGVTLPLGYVRRLNERFSGADAASTYHSIIVDAENQGAIPAISKAIKDAGLDLADKTEKAEQAGMLINIVTLVFSLISVIIVGIAAVNISHTFFMIIFQRKREIGVLRAVGASRGDVRRIILGEALLIGLLGGAFGAVAGFVAARAADVLGGRLPDFPYKPDSFFLFPGWLWPTAIGFAVLFCLLGALFPAGAAARMEPAEALTS